MEGVDRMIVKAEKRYSLSELTFAQIEVICLGLEELDGPDMDSDRLLIAKEILHGIDKELKA